LKAVDGADISLGIVQFELTVIQTVKGNINGVDVRDYRRIVRSAVLEIQSPFDRRKVTVFNADAAED